MIRALYTAASGMEAQQLNLDTIANNLANSSTNGFQGRQLDFEDMIYQNMVAPGAAQSQQTVAAGLQVGLGVRSSATEVIQTQGSLTLTSNPMDMAIQGTGYFSVLLPNGTLAYTRYGAFHQDQQGRIVDANGNPLQPQITIPPNASNVTITQYGVVDATLPGQANPQQLGQIQLTTFPNSGGLASIGNNLMTQTLSSGAPINDVPGGPSGVGTIQDDYLEGSNVDIVTEFVQMIEAQRAFESNSKVVKAADDMYSQVNNMPR
jgi:flagellar basal-body rod protein FlgG